MSQQSLKRWQPPSGRPGSQSTVIEVPREIELALQSLCKHYSMEEMGRVVDLLAEGRTDIAAALTTVFRFMLGDPSIIGMRRAREALTAARWWIEFNCGRPAQRVEKTAEKTVHIVREG